MDKVKEEANSESLLGFKKRKVDDDELQRTQKRRPQQLPAACDYKKAKEDQSEKYILDLETKNKSLLAKITDLSNFTKQLCRENVELHNKLTNLGSSSSTEQSSSTDIKSAKPQPLFRERKIIPQKQENRAAVLNTQALKTLWEQVSSVPLPKCCCSKSDTVLRRRANCSTKKYKEYKASLVGTHEN